MELLADPSEEVIGVYITLASSPDVAMILHKLDFKGCLPEGKLESLLKLFIRKRRRIKRRLSFH